MRRSIWLVMSLVLAPAPLLAQARKPARAPVQQVIPPKTVYWLSAATSSGFAMSGQKFSTGDALRMAMGGGSPFDKVSKTLSLDLGSKLPAAGPPAAAHAIPPVMNMGASLALKTPKPAKAEKSQATPDRAPEDFERPKGKILLFWGCGETARPGQPVVIDFAKLAAGQLPPNLFAGERVRIARPPAAYTWPTWGGWPNDDKPSQKGIPADASLLGPHKVTGNYTPDIDFTMAQDWLASLAMTQSKMPSGALNLGWNAVPGATAHFAQMFGGGQIEGEAGGTIVFWSSSDTQTFISGLSDFIAPAEAARLVGRRQLMPPAQTSCAIPKEAMAATQGAILSLVAHGPEQNFVHPPRPADPRTPWVQQWTVKARFAARAGAIAGMDMAAMGSGAGKAGAGKTGKKPKCRQTTEEIVGGALGGAVGGAIGGLFGGKKKKDCE
jgi:hypothetical protein